MKIRHALGATATAAVLATGLAAPAEAAPRSTSPACTYTLDEAAGTLTGSCDSKKLDATFDGTYAEGSASGAFTISTWLGDIEGTFTGTGFDGGTASGTYTIVTWWGTYSGTFGATAA